MESKKSFIISVLLLILLVGGAAVLYNYLSKNATIPSPDAVTEETETITEDHSKNLNAAPDFAVTNSDGNIVKLSDLKGKPVVINFWASWCGICANEMPSFQKAYDTYGQDVEFMMINLTDGMRESKEDADNFISENSYSFPVYYDTEREAAYAYYVSGIPVTYFVDKDGNLVTGIRGGADFETIQQCIDMITE